MTTPSDLRRQAADIRHNVGHADRLSKQDRAALASADSLEAQADAIERRDMPPKPAPVTRAGPSKTEQIEAAIAGMVERFGHK